MKNHSKAKILLVVFSIFTFGLCLIGQTTFAAPQIAYYAFNSEPILDWDPSVENSNGTIVLNNIYETLLRFDAENNRMVPVLATDY